MVASDIADADLETKLKQWNAFQFERVGLNLRPELVALKDANGDKDDFAKVAKTIAETSEFNLVLMTDNPEVMKAGVEACGFKRPMMYAATEGNIDEYGAIAKENDLPLTVKAESVDGLIPLTEKLTEMGIKDIAIDSGSREIKQAHQDQVAIRRAALKDGNRALGFPTVRPWSPAHL
jgi:acetyl-CoA decarbonylase/synthase complex subunit gamma